MDRTSLEQIDRELGQWLREERLARAPDRLVEDVFARTTRTRQVRRWTVPRWRTAPDPIGGSRTQVWRFASGLAAAATIAVVIVTMGIVLSQTGTGPGSTATPTPTSSPSPSPTPSPSPSPTTLGTLSARSLSLGTDAAPIAVTEAFGSIWVANIHANEVRRYDPATMAEQARIDVPSAAWFAVADGALWVTHQNGRALSRIDPASNTVVANVGDVPPCAEPVVAFDSLWQSACDARVILRIDPTTNEILDRIPSEGHLFLAFAGDRLIALGSDGPASLDPETGKFTPLPNPDAVGAEILASDGDTVWIPTPTSLLRVDPASGRTIATLDYPGVRGIAFANGSAWLTAAEGVVEIDVATNEALRTIPVPGTPLVPYATSDALWVTDFDRSLLWRVDL
jgi:DNA-binding beta-propeller fold protein YncE